MQWPVYSLAEHASELIRQFHNGVPDPDAQNSSPGGSDNSNNTSTNNNNDGGKKGGALSLPIPSILTSTAALCFAAFVVAL